MGWAERGLRQGKELQVLVGSGDSGKWGRLGRVQPVWLAIPVEDKNSGPEVRGLREQSPVGHVVHRLPCQGSGYVVGIESILCSVHKWSRPSWLAESSPTTLFSVLWVLSFLTMTRVRKTFLRASSE